MKKLYNAVSAILLSGILFVSCKKDNPAPAASIVGFWMGKYGTGPTTYPNKSYAFLFRNDGTVRVYHLNYLNDTSAVHKGEGTYSVTGGMVKTSYTLLLYGYEFSTTATIDAHFTFMEGDWEPGLDPSNGGKFFANKH